jgi:tetratricopeptide (TPR) repeat protein
MEMYKEVLRGEWEWKEREWGQVQNNLGCCYGKLGLDKLSMGAYSEALKIYLKYPEVDCSPLFANIANLYFSCKMFSVAEKYYLEAIAERKNKKPHAKHLLYHAYHKLGLAQTEQRKFSEANDSLRKAVRLAQSGFGDAMEVLGEAAMVSELSERWEEALDYYE